VRRGDEKKEIMKRRDGEMEKWRGDWRGESVERIF